MVELYSVNNYRKALIAQAADYFWIARDEALMNRGMYVTILIPKVENNVDEYSDFMDESEDYEQIQTFIEPQFDKYLMTLSLLGQDMERDYPLEISIMSQVNIPRNSIIQMPEINSANQPITREWRVLSTEIKQVGSIYTRIAHATPARTYESIQTDISTLAVQSLFECTGCTVTKEEETWNIPLEVSTAGLFEVIDCLFYEPYGVVECSNKVKITVLRPSIN